jgi:hypothetical protein
MDAPEPKKSIPELLADPTVVDKALKEAVRQALLRHKREGNPIAIWRDGKVVWLQPHEIPVSEDTKPS